MYTPLEVHKKHIALQVPALCILVYTYRTNVSREKFLAPSGQPGGSFYAIWRWFRGNFSIFWGLEEPCQDCLSDSDGGV